MADVLEKVAIGGDSFVVSKFGREKAMIGPVRIQRKKSQKKVDFSKLAAYGMWQDRKDIKDTAKWVADLRRRQSLRIHN